MKIVLLIVCLAIGETISARLERSTGGEPVMIEEASFFVSIRKNNTHKCGGALITGQHVLSAAACVIDSSNLPDLENVVVVGSSTKYRGGTEYPIEFMMIIQDNSNVDRHLDVAVIELPEDVFISEEGHFRLALPIGQPLFYTMANFYAFQSTENPLVNSHLYELPLTPHPDYRFDENGATTSFRASHGNCHTGLEDTGGPLVYNGSLVGIASPLFEPSDNSRVFIWIYRLKDYFKQLVLNVTFLESPLVSI